MPLTQIGEITVQINRKPIKNLHISVLPPDGSVRVSAPEAMTDTNIRLAVINRLSWIKQQQQSFARQARQSVREMVSGECHYLWGKRHRLNIYAQNGRSEVKVKQNKIYLYMAASATTQDRAALLATYYRTLLKQRIAMLLESWQQKLGVSVSSWHIKKMKTRWGSCNTEARRIWFNLELAKKPPECLEYIVVHELIHLLERTHNERFKAYLHRYLPNWQERKHLLNSMPLASTDV